MNGRLPEEDRSTSGRYPRKEPLRGVIGDRRTSPRRVDDEAEEAGVIRWRDVDRDELRLGGCLGLSVLPTDPRVALVLCGGLPFTGLPTAKEKYDCASGALAGAGTG